MAVDLDGTNDYIDCGSGASLDDIAQKTIAFWINLDGYTPGQNPAFVSKALDSSVRGWHIMGRGPSAGAPNDRIQFYQFWTTADGNWNCPFVVTANIWYHIAVSYDRGATTNDPVMYVNGVSQAVTEGGTPSGSVDSDAADSLLVGLRTGALYGTDGRLEDVRVLSRIVSAKEVAILAAGYRGPLGGEVLWLSCDDFLAITHPDGATLTATTNNLPDLSGNGNDGVPTNSPVARASEAPRLGIIPFFSPIGTILVTITGAISSISGTVVKNVSLVRTGAISSISGTIVKAVTKVFTGAITSITGSIAIVYLITLTGSISSIVGAILVERFRLFAKIVAAIAPAIGIHIKTAPAAETETKIAPTTGVKGQ